MIFLALILIGGVLLYAVIVGGAPAKPKGGRGGGGVSAEEIRPRWDLIVSTSKTGASGLKNSVLEADKLLDYVLKKQGYRGETMAERLKKAQSQLSDRNGTWRAHKLRNTIAHEVGFDLVPSQVNEALRDYEKALKDLKVL